MSLAAFVHFIPLNIVVTPLQLMCSEKSSFPQTPPFFLLSWTHPIVPKLNYSIKERGAWTQRDYMGGDFDNASSHLSYCQSPAFQKIILVFCDTKHSDEGLGLILLSSVLLWTKKTTKKLLSLYWVQATVSHSVVFLFYVKKHSRLTKYPQ